ncbi:hypothetical protein QYE76_027939 [Lolium multiflorum]|uniref:Ubiquitin-like domain-containing protein n=1 Tax=Lolium multiflorum TaxID=4521 RepID=A0AAD8VGI8_LOLMU|nr:hypothetical protein QYE76_027939 [Lolium multiflorum]
MGNDVATTRGVGEETIRITVMTITGKVLALDVRSTDTMGHVKTMIGGKLRVPPYRQRFVFDGKVLGDDGRSLADCGVGKEAFLHLAIRRGRPVWVEVFVKVRTQRIGLWHALQPLDVCEHLRDDARDKGPCSLGSPRLFVLLNHCSLVGFGRQHILARPVGRSSATTTSTSASEMAEEPIKYEDLPAEHKKKYDDLKAIFEADLIGSFEKTLARD